MALQSCTPQSGYKSPKRTARAQPLWDVTSVTTYSGGVSEEQISGAEAAVGVRRTPWPLRIGLLVVLGQALLFLGLGVAELIALSSVRLVMGITTALFFFGYGAVLATCARGMWHGSTAGRSVVMMGQLIQLGVAWSYRSATPTLSAVLAVTALIVVVGIMHPASLRALEDD